MDIPLMLKLDDWPAQDREEWDRARQPRAFLSGPRPASRWSHRRCLMVEQAYGQWLSWLLRNGCQFDGEKPAERMTPARVDAFILNLQSRVSPCSVALMIGALQRMMAALAPAADWIWLKTLYANLKAIAKPSRNMFAHMVTPRQLYELGLNLIAEARHSGPTYHASMKARDGLIIAMLISCPVRIANLVQIEIGRHLRFDPDRDRYWLDFSENETKSGQRYQGDLPTDLVQWIEWYLTDHRKRLLARGCSADTRRLWISRFGDPMAEGAIRDQIKRRTKQEFGRHVWPHLFRACAVTGLVDEAPEEIGIAPDLLGHSTLQTTKKHYILSRGARAHAIVQKSILHDRAEAIARLKRRED